ncbi:MAG: aromatic ring-hydroxylating dioxygenase subunit alpha [Pseudomonadota bacterium]
MAFSQQHLAELRAVAAPFTQARTPPGWWFTDPDVHCLDTSMTFGDAWLCAGHSSQFTETGDYRTLDIDALQAIVLRSADERFEAFRNSCRHRGTRLLDGTGHIASRIRCPYHAWAYTLDGDLAAVPHPAGLTRPSDDDLALGHFALERWHDWLFVAKSPSVSLAQQLFDFPALPCLTSSDLNLVAERHYSVGCNWKLLVENFNECYHCPGAHPELHERSRGVGYREYPHRGQAFTGGPMSLEDGYRSLAEPDAFVAPGLAGWRPDDANMVFYFCLYPNFLLTIAPDYVLTHTVWPESEARSRVESQSRRIAVAGVATATPPSGGEHRASRQILGPNEPARLRALRERATRLSDRGSPPGPVSRARAVRA